MIANLSEDLLFGKIPRINAVTPRQFFTTLGFKAHLSLVAK